MTSSRGSLCGPVKSDRADVHCASRGVSLSSSFMRSRSPGAIGSADVGAAAQKAVKRLSRGASATASRVSECVRPFRQMGTLGGQRKRRASQYCAQKSKPPLLFFRSHSSHSSSLAAPSGGGLLSAGHAGSSAGGAAGGGGLAMAMTAVGHLLVS